MTGVRKVWNENSPRPTSPEDPQVFEDRLSKAIELQQQWHFDKAREQYEEILRHEPENADACHNLGFYSLYIYFAHKRLCLILRLHLA